MGGVRTKTVKRAARNIIEKYYPLLTLDFHTNKRVVDEVAVIETKRLRNKIAGYLSHLMKRIEKGPVRGISFKLQVCISFFFSFSFFCCCALCCFLLSRIGFLVASHQCLIRAPLFFALLGGRA